MDRPVYRLQRLRRTEPLRRLARKVHISIDNLVMPVFVCSGKNIKIPVHSMPGCSQLSADNAIAEMRRLSGIGIRSFILFGIPEKKDGAGASAYDDNGVIQQALRKIKKELNDIVVITDVCICEYTIHGHCGIIKREKGGKDAAWAIDNDATLKTLSKVALSHARAGADMVAPSAMMDGQVGAVRRALDKGGFGHIPIMAYSAKYASSFYGPFRDAAGSQPQFGDRKTYQMDPASQDQALREIELDIKEGADIIMVKPALAYLDIIYRAKAKFNMPLAAYNVSGEFAMVKAYCDRFSDKKERSLKERQMVLEVLSGIARAGADIIITYHAPDVAAWLKKE